MTGQQPVWRPKPQTENIAEESYRARTAANPTPFKKYKWTDLILAYQELIEIDGYTRSYGGFKRVAARLKALKPVKKRKKKRKSKPYQRAEAPD